MFNVRNEDIFFMLIPQEDIAFCAVNKCVFMWYLVNATGFVLCAQKYDTGVGKQTNILLVRESQTFVYAQLSW